MKFWLGIILLVQFSFPVEEVFAFQSTQDNPPSDDRQIIPFQQLAYASTSGQEDSLMDKHLQSTQLLAHPLGLDTLEADSLENKGILLWEQGQLDSAVVCFEQSALLYEKLSMTEDAANSYYNSGSVRHQQQQYNLAEKYFLRSYQLFRDTRQRSEMAYWLGMNYRKMNQNLKALKYLFLALTYFKKEELVDWQTYCYSSIGTAYLQLREFEQAQSFHSEALQLSEKTAQYYAQASTRISLGKLAEEQGDFPEAIRQYQLAHQIEQNHHFKDLAGYTLSNIGQAYYQTAQYDSSRLYLNRANQQKSGSISPAHLQIELGRLALAQQDSVQAYLHLQNATHQLNISMEYPYLPQAKNITSAEEYLDFLEVMGQYHEVTGSVNYEALACYERAVSFLLTEFLPGQYGEATQKAQLDKYYSFYERAIRLIYEHYDATQDNLLLNRAYTLFEQSKAVLLRFTLAYQSGDTLTQPYLKQQQVVNEAQQAWLKAIIEGKDSVALWDYRIKYIAAEAASLPLKRQSSIFDILSLDTLQTSLATDVALLTFFQGTEHLYSITVTSDTTLFDRVDQSQNLNQHIKEFYQVVSDLEYVRQQLDEATHQLATSGYAVYREIIPDFLKESLNDFHQLVVVPDQSLLSLPFEALLTQPAESERVGSFPFLCQRWEVRYAYSASQALTRQPGTQRENVDQIAGFAVDYSSSDSASKYQNLSGAQRILTYLNQHLQSDISPNTSKGKFLTEAAKYPIVHFAGHAELRYATADNHLVFGNNGQGYELLYAPELRNTNLSGTSLIVLSACNTGTGTYQAGLGVRSIAQSFAYAGVPSIILSLFDLPDRSSAEVMVQFYAQLSQHRRSSEALRLAKLAYLQSVGSDRLRSHPVYWAGLVLTGEDQFFQFTSHTQKHYLWGALSFGLLLLLALVYRKLFY